MTWTVDQLGGEVRKRLSAGAVVRVNEPLASHTTLKVGGKADCYVEPTSEADLTALTRWCWSERVPLFVLGRGSNLLIRDGGLRGVVVCLANPAFARVECDADRLRCGAGARLKAVAQVAREVNLGGMEFLEGIPGSLGGALRMNAGAMGCGLYEIVVSVWAMSQKGTVLEVPRDELQVAYRDCALFRDHLALGAVLQGEPTSLETITERRRLYNERRWSTQPAAPSAGCMFKNPPGIAAGRLIDELGLKGARVGKAVVSDVHANFIVNEGGATASEVLALVSLVRERVEAERGIALETEVEIVGEGLD
jgi:UDP-N-acetylenolpyruvoylglucosamine reductase